MLKPGSKLTLKPCIQTTRDASIGSNVDVGRGNRPLPYCPCGFLSCTYFKKSQRVTIYYS